jgi:hypothetical protein
LLIGCAPPRWLSSVGDRHDEQSLAPHGVSRCGRAEYSRRNAVAQSLQCRHDGPELSVSIARDVLAEDKIRPALLGEAADLGGKEAIAVGASALSGNAVVLTGVA